MQVFLPAYLKQILPFKNSVLLKKVLKIFIKQIARTAGKLFTRILAQSFENTVNMRQWQKLVSK